MRLSTVLAACAPSGSAAWQLIRSGRSDGEAASPAATMRGSSTLVRVSSVSSRPSASVRQAAGGGKSRHAETRRPDRDGARRARVRRRSTTESGRTSVAWTWAVQDGDAELGQPLGDRRRPGAGGTGRARPPQTSVTRRPASANSVAASTPSTRRRSPSSARRGRQRRPWRRSALRQLQFGDRIGEFGGAGDTRAPRRCCRRRRSGSRSPSSSPRGELIGARGRVDAGRRVDDQIDPVAKQDRQ